MKAAHRKVPIAQLTDAIEATLARAPSLIQDLCLELGYSRHAIYVRLLDLMASGRARCVEVKTKTASGNGIARRWEIGKASPEQLDKMLRVRRARCAVADRGPIESPCQVTIRAYPALRLRDPLVAALFGPAGQAGA